MIKLFSMIILLSVSSLQAMDDDERVERRTNPLNVRSTIIAMQEDEPLARPLRIRKCCTKKNFYVGILLTSIFALDGMIYIFSKERGVNIGYLQAIREGKLGCDNKG